jgi:multiple sugar transport system permease protein
MFPTPIQKRSRAAQISYQTLLPLALILWLLPLIAVMLFSIRPFSDFSAGNYWGVPSSFELFANYGRVFFDSDMPRYLLNSVLITVPTVIGAVALSCMTGFALGIYRFKGNLLIFFMFIAGNFVPFQILMVPVRDLTLGLGLYDTKLGLSCSTSRSRPGSARSSCATSSARCPMTDRGRAGRGRRGMAHLLVRRAAPDAAGHRGAVGADLHLHLERLFLGDRADPGPERAAGDGGDHVLQLAVRGAVSPDERGQHRRAIPPVVMFFLMQRHFIAGLTLGAVK